MFFLKKCKPVKNTKEINLSLPKLMLKFDKSLPCLVFYVKFCLKQNSNNHSMITLIFFSHLPFYIRSFYKYLLSTYYGTGPVDPKYK